MTQVVESEKGRKEERDMLCCTSGEHSLEKEASDWLLSRQFIYLTYFFVLEEKSYKSKFFL